MKTFLPLSFLLIVACASASKSARLPATDNDPRESPVTSSLIQPGDGADGLPVEASELLEKSMTDSCSSCARDFRRHAFRLLEARFPPGLVLRSDSLSRFARAPAGENELMIASQPGAGPKLTFRFHTIANRLVGIADSDMTDEGLADWCRSAPAGEAFDGELEIVAFAYGDGPTFLYHASSNTIELQCRVLAVSGDEPPR